MSGTAVRPLKFFYIRPRFSLYLMLSGETMQNESLLFG